MKLTSFALIEKDDNYLLIRETKQKSRGKWFFPGGEIKKNESPEQAVLRETKEEASCEILIKGILYSRCDHKLIKSNLSFFYYAEAITKGIKTQPDKHSQEARWFNYEEIRSLPLRDDALDIINTYRNLKKSHSLN